MTVATALSVLALGFLGWAVPVLVSRVLPDTLRGLAAALAISVPVLTLAGAGIFFASYAQQLGLAVAGRGETLRHVGGLGLRAALVWGPVLALTGLGLAQGVERRRGARMAARDRD